MPKCSAICPQVAPLRCAIDIALPSIMPPATALAIALISLRWWSRRNLPRRLASSDFLALERFQLAMLDAYLIPRSRDERPITALRVLPSVLAISAALRPPAHSCSRRLSPAGVQNDFMAAPQATAVGFGGSPSPGRGPPFSPG